MKTANKRILVNTLINYFRLGSIICLSIFTTRFVYGSLGEVDFAVYNLVGGIVLLFAFLSNTLTLATQRFISYSLGENKDKESLANLFYSCFILHLGIAVILVILVQVCGIPIIDRCLNIPMDKIQDAHFILLTVSLGLFGTIIGAPFEAILVSRENILFLSITQLIIALLRFIIALILIFIPFDRLHVYALLIALLPYIQLLINWVYCTYHYSEARITISKIKDLSNFRVIASYVGWVIIGNGCGAIRQQGIGIVLNVCYGIIMNAANAIAMQINSLIMQYSSSISFSIRPQLISSAGKKDQERFKSLTIASCIYPLTFTAFLSIPLIVAMPEILKLWLGEIPPYTIGFCKILLLSVLVSTSTIGLTSALEACGKVKLLHLTVGFAHLIPIILGFVLISYGCPPYSVFWCIVGVEIYASIIRIILAHKYINVPILDFISRIYLRLGGSILLYYLSLYLIWSIFEHTTLNLILLCVAAIVLFPTIIYCIAMDTENKAKCKSIIITKMNKSNNV